MHPLLWLLLPWVTWFPFLLSLFLGVNLARCLASLGYLRAHWVAANCSVKAHISPNSVWLVSQGVFYYKTPSGRRLASSGLLLVICYLLVILITTPRGMTEILAQILTPQYRTNLFICQQLFQTLFKRLKKGQDNFTLHFLSDLFLLSLSELLTMFYIIFQGKHPSQKKKKNRRKFLYEHFYWIEQSKSPKAWVHGAWGHQECWARALVLGE